MLERLLLAGILTFTLSLFAQVHRPSPLGKNPQINTENNTVLTFNQPGTKLFQD
ncbi:hypothetical protein ACQFX9_29645 [Aliinostoc sp. HNIBRCY26]|uniref:hypothetical protein n=1 Tax=Aliinostoc sp. HNIBRCY26 TaxID=3418997 RepID=UPI003CFF2788